MAPFNSLKSAMERSPLTTTDEAPFRHDKHQRILFRSACRSATSMLQSISRSGYGAQVASFAIATTAVVGMSTFPVGLWAMAAELDGGKPTIVSMYVDPSSSSNPNHDANPDFNFSMAIPIPHDESWFSTGSGFIAPLPRFKGDGLVIPPPQVHKSTASLKGSIFKCPQWTPSELEMVLPDFQGRPKPFRHQWSASVTIKQMPDESLPELSNLGDDPACDNTVAKDEDSVSADMAPSGEEMLALLKLLGMEKFMCFSM